MNRKYLLLTILSSVMIFHTLTLTAVQGQEDNSHNESTQKAALAIGAGLAVGLCGIGAGIGMGNAGAAAIGAIVEDPAAFAKSMIFIVFIEAVAIYGLVISLLFYISL